MMNNEEVTKGYYYLERPKGSDKFKHIKTNHSDIFNENTYTGIFSAEIITKKPLSVSQGEFYTDNDGLVYELVRDSDENIWFPGSSFKGAIRTYCEVLSSSLDKNNITDKIFGSLSNKTLGKILFNDFLYKGNTDKVKVAKQWSHEKKLINRPESESKIRIYSHKNHEPQNKNFIKFEVIPANEKIEFSVNFINLTKEEMGLFFLGLGIGTNYKFALKIGKGKNFDLGSVLINPLKIKKSKNDFEMKRSVRSSDNLIKYIDECIEIYIEKSGLKNYIEKNVNSLADDSSEVINNG